MILIIGGQLWFLLASSGSGAFSKQPALVRAEFGDKWDSENDGDGAGGDGAGDRGAGDRGAGDRGARDRGAGGRGTRDHRARDQGAGDRISGSREQEITAQNRKS